MSAGVAAGAVNSSWWSWSWIPDPSPEFGDNLMVDWLRLGIVVWGVYLLAGIGQALREQRRREFRFSPGQYARFLSLIFTIFYICLTEIAVFGTPMTPRFFVGFLALALCFYGLRKLRVKQKSSPIVRRKEPNRDQRR